jgi:hypothetical protein
VAGGTPSLTGTCGTCHDTPNVGNHSFPTPLDIGAGDFSATNPSQNMGGLDVSYLPQITVCQLVNSQTSNNCKTTTDLGQALIDGQFAHVGKLKGPILRGLSARAPYFYNGSAQSLLDIANFYNNRFGMGMSQQDIVDLVNFLSVLCAGASETCLLEDRCDLRQHLIHDRLGRGLQPFAASCRKVERTRLIAAYNSRRLRSGPYQRHGEARRSREATTSCDRKDHRNLGHTVESFR